MIDPVTNINHEVAATLEMMMASSPLLSTDKKVAVVFSENCCDCCLSDGEKKVQVPWALWEPETLQAITPFTLTSVEVRAYLKGVALFLVKKWTAAEKKIDPQVEHGAILPENAAPETIQLAKRFVGCIECMASNGYASREGIWRFKIPSYKVRSFREQLHIPNFREQVMYFARVFDGKRLINLPDACQKALQKLQENNCNNYFFVTRDMEAPYSWMSETLTELFQRALDQSSAEKKKKLANARLEVDFDYQICRLNQPGGEEFWRPLSEEDVAFLEEMRYHPLSTPDYHQRFWDLAVKWVNYPVIRAAHINNLDYHENLLAYLNSEKRNSIPEVKEYREKIGFLAIFYSEGSHLVIQTSKRVPDSDMIVRKLFPENYAEVTQFFSEINTWWSQHVNWREQGVPVPRSIVEKWMYRLLCPSFMETVADQLEIADFTEHGTPLVQELRHQANSLAHSTLR